MIKPTPETLQKAIGDVANHHDMVIKQVILPSERRNSIIVEGQNDTSLVRIRANNVIFNPDSGDYMSHRFAQEQSIHVRISEAADPLHFGTFFGIYSKVVYFIFGVVLSALAVSGTYLYGLRHNRLYKKDHNTAKESWTAAYQGMGRWKWLSIVLIAISLILTVILFFQIVAI